MVHTEPRAEDSFNSEELLDTFMDCRDTARSILSRFLERTVEQLRHLPELEAREDWETARREAHTIKGSGMTLSGKELGLAAARLEKAYFNVDHAEMAAALPAVQAAFGRFSERAEAWLRSEEAGAGETGV